MLLSEKLYSLLTYYRKGENAMPILDLSLKELLSYKGMNPKPADFDEYWRKALHEMKALGTRYALEPVDMAIPFGTCHSLYFTGVGGARVHAKLVKPGLAGSKNPAVIMFHGYKSSSGDWFDKLPYVAAGFTVAALDCRGQGGTSEDSSVVKGNTDTGHIIRGLSDSPDKLLYRQIFLDTAQLASIVMSMDDVDADRVGVTGASQGGALSIACAALEPRVARVAAIYPFLSDYKRAWDMDCAEKAYAELKTYFRKYDPTHAKESEIFERLGYIDIQNLSPRIEAKVLFATGLADDVCPPSTQFAAYNKIRSEKELVVYPDFGHELLEGLQDKIFRFMMGL
jgi:cephalosporin-C deacetylase